MFKDKFLNCCALEELRWVIRMIQEDFDKKYKCEKSKAYLYVSEDTNIRLYNT